MLHIQLKNITPNHQLHRVDGSADYEARVYINERRIFKATILNHIRNNGWTDLVRALVDAADAKQREVSKVSPV